MNRSTRRTSKKNIPAHIRAKTEEELEIREHFGHLWEILGQHASRDVWSIITNDLKKADLLVWRSMANRERDIKLYAHRYMRKSETS